MICPKVGMIPIAIVPYLPPSDSAGRKERRRHEDAEPIH
jgi:hypothetical protein